MAQSPIKLTLTPITDKKDDKPKPFIFDYVEVPESIGVGGQHRMAVHHHVGGGRTIDMLGRDDVDLVWTGLFTGKEAQNRCSYLDGIRVSGKKQRLTWHKYDYDVVIAEFLPKFEKDFRVPYSITFKVVKDNTKPNKTFNPSGMDDAISSDTKSLTSMASSIGDSGLSSAVSTLSSAVKSVTTFVGATQSTISSVMQPLMTVQSQIKTLIGNNSVGVGLPLNAINSQLLTAQTQYLSKLPVLNSMLATANRIASNLTLTSGSSSTMTVTQTGGTLFDLAAQHYGDPTQWVAIAQANNLTTPYLDGINTIKIPVQTNNTGGIYER